jgi:hypothetical protein
MPEKDVYTFVKESLEKADVKFALGLTLFGDKYLKIKFLDVGVFNAGLGIIKRGSMVEAGLIAGLNIKKKIISFDMGLSSPLKDLEQIKGIKPRLWAGISFYLF